MAAHVVVQQLLEVLGQAVAQGPDQHVGADAAITRHVPVRVGEAHVRGIVGDGHPDLSAGGGDDLVTGLRMKRKQRG